MRKSAILRSSDEEIRHFVGKSAILWGNPPFCGEIRHFVGKIRHFVGKCTLFWTPERGMGTLHMPM